MQMEKLDKHKLLASCRNLWNEFDPIGVRSLDPEIVDEYDFYLSHTADLVKEGADRDKLTAYVENCVHVNMGLRKTTIGDNATAEFVQKLLKLRV